ncbi:MAG: cytochrome c3 family protein [Acidobacteriota bacterium]
MKLKLAVVITYALGLAIPAALGAGLFAQPGEQQQTASGFAPKILRLDEKGRRGVVFFDHKGHEKFISLDPTTPHPAKKGAACVGCHHTVSARGIPELYKCNVCHHRKDGDARNPKNKEFDEVMAERAFHDSCIGCHRAAEKGPTTCSGCHKLGIQSGTVGTMRALDKQARSE